MTEEKGPSWVIEQLNKVAEHVRKQEARMEAAREEQERKLRQEQDLMRSQIFEKFAGRNDAIRRAILDAPVAVGTNTVGFEGALGKLAATMKERGRTCGEYRNVARVAQDIKGAIHVGILASQRESGSHPAYMLEALDMIAHKIARIVAGDPWHVDSWHDIQGYAKLVEDRILQDKEPKRG